MANDEKNEPKAPPQRRTDLILAVALLALAGYLVASRYMTAAVDWHLGDLRRDPGDLEARRALAELGDRALPRLEEDLRSTDLNARLIAVFALDAIDGAGAERLLAEAARNDDPLTASNALDRCTRRRDGVTLAGLAGALGDPRRQVRLAARQATSRRLGAAPWWALGVPGGG